MRACCLGHFNDAPSSWLIQQPPQVNGLVPAARSQAFAVRGLERLAVATRKPSALAAADQGLVGCSAGPVASAPREKSAHAVVARSPDRATLADRRSPLRLL